MSGHRFVFGWYLAGAACHFIPFGIHNVLYAWLIAVQLGEQGDRLGFAQMCAQLPGLVFILFGGLLADRLDRRKILMLFHFGAALPPLLLALAIYEGHLSYWLLIGFALSVGVLNAFILPARDSLLNQVAGRDLQRSVSLVMGLSFFCQIVGYALVSQADDVGPAALLVIQGCLLAGGCAFAFGLPRKTEISGVSIPAGAKQSGLTDIKAGIVLIASSERMAPVMILMCAIGMFYSGAFFVVNPLVVRDVYGGGASDIALSYICFMVGTVATTFLLVVTGGIRRQGLGLMLALVSGGAAITVTSLQLPFSGYLLCIGLWGVAAGFAMSLGRAIVQEAAPEAYRARALSVYSLGNLGFMPVGSLLQGYLAVTIGPLNGYLVSAAGMFATVVVVALTTQLSRVEVNL